MWALVAALVLGAAVAAGLGCPNCVLDHRQLDNLRIDEIKQNILNKLGFRIPPNVTQDVPKEVLLQTLSKAGADETRVVAQSAHEDEEDGPSTSKIISYAEAGPQLNNNTMLEFTQSNVDVGLLMVTDATLWIFLRKVPGSSRRKKEPLAIKSTLWVFRVIQDSSQTTRAQFISSVEMSSMKVGWHKLNITSAVTRWFSRPGESLRLLVDCNNCDGEIEATLFATRKRKGAYKPGSRKADYSHRPFLVIETAPAPSKKLARRALQCDKDTKQCCKQKLFISFREINWSDWIIAPSGYNANYCRGECSSIYRTLDGLNTIHSHVLEEYRRYRAPGTISQCCAPTRHSSVTIIYIDEQSNIIKRTIPRMTVEECGCS